MNGGDSTQAIVVPCTEHALLTVEGETEAAQYLARLQAPHADPDELALIVCMLYGAALRCVGRVIETALGVRHA